MPTGRAILSGIANVLFGPSDRTPVHPAMPEPRPAPAVDEEFSQATLDDVARVRAGVRQHFETKRAAEEKELGLDEKRKRLERAQAFLRKANVEAIFASILRNTWHWDAWKEKGELDDLPRYGLDVVSVHPKQDVQNNHHTKGYTISIDGRPYDVDFIDKGRGYTPDGHGDRYGEVTVARDGDLLFACSINEHSTDYTNDWKLSIWGLRVLKDVSWLTDFAEFSEIVEQRARRRRQSWNDKRIIDQAEAIIDPTKPLRR